MNKVNNATKQDINCSDGITNAREEARLRQLAHNLGERIKELNCLYSISRLFESRPNSIDETLQGVVDAIPPAWQYPEVTCARIILKDGEFRTANFRETSWKQTQNIMVNGRQFGMLEVYYLEQRPESDDGPFLKEERNLLRVIAERLGHIIAREIANRDLKALYDRERKLRERLQAEIKTRVDFTRKLIHELKTPLTSLMATSQLMCDETEGKELSKLARYIWEAVNDMDCRVEELHDVTRGELGTLKLSLKEVIIDQLLRSVVEETEPLFQQRDMSIELEIPEPLPVVRADSGRIRQIMLNLLNNACKYAREGKKVVVKAIRKADNVLVEVRDYGPGIPVAQRTTLFEPGYQSMHPDERTGGLGIGLSLCKMLVELHGGQIWAKSRLGKGSSFFFTVPVQELAAEG